MKNSRKDSYKIGLMGASLNTGNRGVSALATSLVKITKSCIPKSEISFFIGNRSADPILFKLADRLITAKTVNFRLSPRADIQEHLYWIFFLAIIQKLIPINYIKAKIIRSNFFLSQIYCSDFIGDIRGGDSFSDIYGVRKFVERCMPAFIILFLNKKLSLLPQTYGPYNSYISKLVARYLISRSFNIVSRDESGVKFLKSLVKNKKNNLNIRFCPDTAFMLDSIKPEHINIDPSLDLNSNHAIIGLNINGLMYNGGYNRRNMFGLKFDYPKLILMLTKSLLRKTSAHILLIPHAFGPAGNINSDPDACKSLLNHISYKDGNRIHMVASEYDQSEIKWIIGKCGFFIGSRMHACIAALSQGIPTIGIAYSKKFNGVFDSINSKDTVIDARLVNMESIINIVFEIYHKRENLIPEIVKNVEAARKKIISTFKEILV